MALEKRLAVEWGLTVDPMLHDLLERDEEQVKLLEGQIIEEGCLFPLTVWKETNIIVDGNTRYDICTEHNVPFAVEYMSFAKKSEAMQWAKEHQESRRNMTKPQLIDVVHKIEGQIRAEARERQGTRTDLGNIVENFPQGQKSRDRLGAMAGVSGKTYEKGTHILDNAPEPIREAWKREQIKTEPAYQVTKLPEEAQQRVADELRKGEKKPKEVVREAINEYKKEGKMEATTVPAMGEKTGRTAADKPSMGGAIQAASSYSIDDLLEEVKLNGEEYLLGLRTLIEMRFPQFDNDVNRAMIRREIEQIIRGFKRLKEDIQ